MGVAEGDVGEKEKMKAVKVIGRGAMGTVFLVRKEGSDTPLALKAISKRVMQNKSGAVKQYHTETQILADIRTHPHPFLPNLLSHVETDTLIGWVGDYCPGGHLNDVRLSHFDGVFPESVIRFYAAEIVLALEHLHGLGIVYRDLKPENILVRADGHIMLTDFDLSTKQPATVVDREHPLHLKHSKRAGLLTSLPRPCICPSAPLHAKSQVKRSNCARVSPINRNRKASSEWPSNENCRSNSFAGTEEYVSPEMVKGTGHGFGVDWWAFGIILYEMLNGKTPFKGVTRKETFYNILVQQPALEEPWTPLRHLILQLLQKDPRARLGFCNGALDIKRHIFFRGLNWDAIHLVSRPPFVPFLQPSVSMPSLDIHEFLHGWSETLGSTDRIAQPGNAYEEHRLDGSPLVWAENFSKSAEESVSVRSS